MKGKIKAVLAAECGNCNTMAISRKSTAKAAMKDLKHRGWITRDGLLICPSCVILTRQRPAYKHEQYPDILQRIYVDARKSVLKNNWHGAITIKALKEVIDT